MLNILKQIHSEFPEMDIDTLLRIVDGLGLRLVLEER